MFDRLHLDPAVSSSSLLAALAAAAGLFGLHSEPAEMTGKLVTRPQSVAARVEPALVVNPVQSEVARAQDGMFYLDGAVNGRSVRFLVDTGASVTVLTPGDAARLDVVTDRESAGRIIVTAGGQTWGSTARIANLKIGGLALVNLTIVVVDTGVGTSLIGQDLLRKIGPVRFDGDRMTLEGR